MSVQPRRYGRRYAGWHGKRPATQVQPVAVKTTTAIGERNPAAPAATSVRMKKTPRQMFKERFYGTPEEKGTPELRARKRGLRKNLLNYEFGKNSPSKVLYGKDYRRGTVGRLNRTIARGQKVQKQADTAVSSLTKQASTVTDAARKAALEAKAQKIRSQTKASIKATKQASRRRQKYLDIRNRRLQKIFVNRSSRNKAAERARKKVARKRYRKYLGKTA